MNNKSLAKILIIAVILFVVISPNFLYAFELTATEAVSVSARVGLDVVVDSSAPAGAVLLPSTAVQFSGRAYPGAQVILLRDGVEKATVVAGADAYFSITIPEEKEGNILYTLQARDLQNNKSLFLNFPTQVNGGFLTYLNNILFAPTIFSNKIESRASDYVEISGYAIPSASMEITIKGENIEKVFSLTSNKDGSYKISLPLSNLPVGDYVIHINYKNDTRTSRLLRLKIGATDVLNGENIPNIPGDCNKDSIVNLIDFSVLAFWYGKENPPVCVDTNIDGKINLIDFSILAFYWTG